MFFSGQGPVFVAPADPTTGVLGAFFDLGNLESISTSNNETTVTDKESKTGFRQVAASIATELVSSVQIVLKEPNLKNLELMFRSAKVAVAGATATDEINSGTGLVAGDYLITKHQNISAVSVKDSAGSPATLTPTTDYIVESTKFGRIRLVNVGSYTQPFKVTYTYAARTVVPFFNSTQKQFFVHMEGINTVDYTNFLAQFYRLKFSPPEDFNLMTDEFGRFTLNATVESDPTRESDPNFGKYGRLVNPL